MANSPELGSTNDENATECKHSCMVVFSENRKNRIK